MKCQITGTESDCFYLIKSVIDSVYTGSILIQQTAGRYQHEKHFYGICPEEVFA